MKKIFVAMMCLAVMMASNTGLKAQEVTITLNPGWTWISVPLMDTLDFPTALGSFTPMQGDIIKSQWGSASYRGNGQWSGSVSQFYPGYGYMYKSNRTLPVNVIFQAQQSNPQNNVPMGAIVGLFSVSESQQVYFSQGNLQYQASTNTWRFAENQWDYVGTQTPGQNGFYGGNVIDSDNNNISQTYSGWIDLFGWGTSGYNHGALCYQPWSVSSVSTDYFAYGNRENNLYDGNGQADWGYNAILNGGNQVNNGWRTLTNAEWTYLYNTRSTASNIRYAKANVNGVNGIILLPDDWDASWYVLSNTNTPGSGYNNTITTTDWTNIFEANGAVFLPAAGRRYGTSVRYASISGYYWSSSHVIGINSDANDAYFSNDYINTCHNASRRSGRSVRLVRDAE